MTPAQLTTYLQFAIKNTFPVLIKGRPGIGKSDIVEQACKLANARLIISHPVVSDPTDYKGLPYAFNNEAHFLPFHDLKQLIDATVPTVFFLDDLGQAPATVQAACMQLILARQINGHKVSDQVTFLAATNRKEDKAAVSGLLEPVKSRFKSIIELETTTEDWIKWALNTNMPIELIAFIRFKPAILEDFKPTKDIVNTASPRTIANAGAQQVAGLDSTIEFEVYKGAAGETFAIEYTAFLKLFRELPNIDQIILNPANAPVPTEPGILFALSGAVAHKMNDTNIEALIQYLDRIPTEYAIASIKDAVTRKPELTNTRAFIKWGTDKGGIIL